MDIMRLRHVPLQLQELFHPHVSKQRCQNHVSSVKNKPGYFSVFSFLSLQLSPSVLTFVMKT